MQLNLDLPPETLPICEHECICGTCNDYNRRDCNFYQAKVDRNLLVLAANTASDERMWQSSIDKVTASWIAETIAESIGMDLSQITYDAQNKAETTG